MTQIGGTVAAGNTKVRSYTFTFWNEDEITEFLNLECKYLLLCWEICPKTKKEHCHGAVWFSNARHWNAMKTMFPKSHIEMVRDWPHIIEYIKEEGVWIEYGEPPKSHRCLTGRELKEMSEYDINFKYPLNAKSLCIARNVIIGNDKKNKFLNDLREKNDTKPEVIYICGYTGMGKTKLAYEYAIKKYRNEEIGIINFSNGFAHGVNLDAPCLICDEFRESEVHAAEFLKFIDRYVYDLNVKGSNIIIKPKCIIISSIKRIEELYKDKREINDQFRRRISKIVDLGGYKVEEEKIIEKVVRI